MILKRLEIVRFLLCWPLSGQFQTLFSSPRVMSELCTLQLGSVHAWPAQIPETVNWELSSERRGHVQHLEVQVLVDFYEGFFFSK